MRTEPVDARTLAQAQQARHTPVDPITDMGYWMDCRTCGMPSPCPDRLAADATLTTLNQIHQHAEAIIDIARDSGRSTGMQAELAGAIVALTQNTTTSASSSAPDNPA